MTTLASIGVFGHPKLCVFRRANKEQQNNRVGLVVPKLDKGVRRVGILDLTEATGLNQLTPVLREDDPTEYLQGLLRARSIRSLTSNISSGEGVNLSAPIDTNSQAEVWGAALTYDLTIEARKAELHDMSAHTTSDGVRTMHDILAESERPHLFFKATPRMVTGNRDPIHLRSDTRWMVSEVELVIIYNQDRKPVAYTIGNDVSCRDILHPGTALHESPAKMFNGCCPMGPFLELGPIDDSQILDRSITVEIVRKGEIIFTGTTPISKMNRTFDELSRWLFRDNQFPDGVYLMTGNAVPSKPLERGDIVRITIDEIGTLENYVENPLTASM